MSIDTFKFFEIDFVMLALSKNWLTSGQKTYPEAHRILSEAYAKEYSITLDYAKEHVEEFLVHRWLELNDEFHFFKITHLVKYMEPERCWYFGYPNELRENDRYSVASLFQYNANYDAGYYGNWLKGILSALQMVEASKLPGFKEWLIDNGYRSLNE